MRDTVHGRVGYLLALVALLHFIYPITLDGSTATLILYQLLYAGMFVVGIFVASDSRAHLIASVSTALVAGLRRRFRARPRQPVEDSRHLPVTEAVSGHHHLDTPSLHLRRGPRQS
jgi:hypothetical protein